MEFNYTLLNSIHVYEGMELIDFFIPLSFVSLTLLLIEYGKFYTLRNNSEDENSESDENINEKEDETESYKKKYFDDYDELESKELTENYVKDLKLNIIKETTPKGDIIMYYDSNLESFIYHCKSKDIPFEYLETVARKYVITYDCKVLYVDIRKEIEKGVQKVKEVIAKKENEKNMKLEQEKKKKTIYATFKTYNRKAEVNPEQKDKIYVLKENCNRYSYRGKIEDYKEIHINERGHVNERGEVSEENTNNKNECSDVEKTEIINTNIMNYAEFKKLKQL